MFMNDSIQITHKLVDIQWRNVRLMQGTSKHKVLFIHPGNEIHQNQTCSHLDHYHTYTTSLEGGTNLNVKNIYKRQK